MATSIGRLALLIGADASGADEGIAKAEKRLKDLKDASESIDDRKGLGTRLAEGIAGFAGKVQTGLGVVKTGMDLMRGKVETTGEALGRLGEVASLIPGPWGAAAGTVLSAAGQIVDYFQGPLLRSQRAAREAFLSVATGARTIEQAASDVRLGALTEGLERMVALQQRSEQFAGGVFGSFHAFSTNVFGGALGAGQEAAEATPEGIVRRMEERRAMLQRLVANPQFRAIRGDMAAELASNEMTEMGRGAGLRVARRSLAATVRGEEGQGGMSAEMALRTVALERFTAQGIQPTAQQLAALEQQGRRTAEALRAQGAQNAMERYAGETAAANTALSQQMATFGMSARAAAAHNLELRRRDVLERLSAANQDRLTPRERTRLRVQQQQIDQNLAALRAGDQVLTQMEAQQRLSQETTQAQAQIDHLRAQQARPGQVVPDMSREEAELAQLRLQGAQQWRLELQQANIDALRGVRLQQQLAQAAAQAFASTRTPLEQYEQAVARAEQIFMASGGTAADFDLYARQIDQAATRLEQAGAQNTEHGAGSAMFAGSREAQAALARNNRRQQGEDRAAQLRRTIEEMRRTQEEQARDVRTMARELASGRVRLVLRPMNLGGG